MERTRDVGPRTRVACVRGAVGHLDRAAVSTSSSKASFVRIQASAARTVAIAAAAWPGRQRVPRLGRDAVGGVGGRGGVGTCGVRARDVGAHGVTALARLEASATQPIPKD